MTELVQLSIDGGVACIHFNRPERLNALDLQTAQAFRAAVARTVADRSVRAIVLSGEGRAFVSGGDLMHIRDAADPAAAAGELIDAMHEALLLLHESNIPSIAALKGGVAGAGVSLALMATFAVAAESTTLNLAYIRVAATPDCGGSWALTHLLGPRRAAEIILLAEPIGAQQAHQLGLVNKVVSLDRVDKAAREMASRLAAGPSLATKESLGLIGSAPGAALADHLAREREAFVTCARSNDFREAVNAFFSKRTPAFDHS